MGPTLVRWRHMVPVQFQEVQKFGFMDCARRDADFRCCFKFIALPDLFQNCTAVFAKQIQHGWSFFVSPVMSKLQSWIEDCIKQSCATQNLRAAAYF